MTDVKIRRVEAPDELFRHYPGQSGPQPAELSLDIRDGDLACGFNPELGPPYGQTTAVAYGLVLTADIPVLTADAANRLLDEAAPIAQRVLDGADEYWNGDNRVGRLNPAAESAWGELVDLCSVENFDARDMVSGWSVSDWFSEGDDATIAELGLTADTTDARLTEIAAEQVELAKTAGEAGYGVLDPGRTYEYLDRLRDDLRDVVREELGEVAVKVADLDNQRDDLLRRIHGWGERSDSLRALGGLAGLSHTQVARIVNDSEEGGTR